MGSDDPDRRRPAGFWVLALFHCRSASAAAPQATPTGKKHRLLFRLPSRVCFRISCKAIVRQVWLKTDITSNTTYTVSEYTVQPGDALFSIAKQFKIKPETLLWANDDILKDSPDSLRVGQVLKVPPADGVYYQVQAGDTLESIAEEVFCQPG